MTTTASQVHPQQIPPPGIEPPRDAGPIIRAAFFGNGSMPPPALGDLLRGVAWCELTPLSPTEPPRTGDLKDFDVAVVLDVAGPGQSIPQQAAPYEALLAALRRHRVGALVVTSRPWAFARHTTGVVCLPPQAGLERLRGALTALAHLRPVMRQIDLELTSMQHLGDRLARHFDELDQELRLASRLQHDFLPRTLPRVHPLRFATLFRPCSWVSGDIFDVFRLDEHHVGFYLADAVGHGVAAGLLTMFIKNAIHTRQVSGNDYVLVPPHKVLAHLNDALAAQELPDSQFVTAWYGLIDTRSLQLTYASGGHPAPVLVRNDGSLAEIEGDGCLLGVFAGQPFTDQRLQLQPGQRLLLFSDGLEPAIISSRQGVPAVPTFAAGIADLVRLPPAQFVEALVDRLDAQPGSLAGADDASLVLVDVVDGPPPSDPNAA